MTVTERYIFNNSIDAIRELVTFVKACLAVGGIPQTYTHYGGLEFVSGKYLGILVKCYGRGEILHGEWIFAPESDEEWSRLVKTLSEMVGDWRYILEKYGNLVTTEEALRRKLPFLSRKIVQELSKLPVLLHAVELAHAMLKS